MEEGVMGGGVFELGDGGIDGGYFCEVVGGGLEGVLGGGLDGLQVGHGGEQVMVGEGVQQ